MGTVVTEKETKEVILKEYPALAYLVDGFRTVGLGNVILTSERLIYLNQAVLSEYQRETIRQLTEAGEGKKLLDYVVTLDKNNFDIPLANIQRAKLGVYTYFPMMRFCTRIFYHVPKKKTLKEATFRFRIPFLQGIYKLEISVCYGWSRAINSALGAKRYATQ